MVGSDSGVMASMKSHRVFCSLLSWPPKPEVRHYVVLLTLSFQRGYDAASSNHYSCFHHTHPQHCSVFWHLPLCLHYSNSSGLAKAFTPSFFR
jgi:hypothetical protein